MPVRINVKDLSPPAESSPSPLFRLAYHHAGKYHAHPIDEGETTIGASPLCGISIPVPGVMARHASLKRQGKKIFIRGLGRGGVHIHGREIREPTPLAAGEPFAMGPVTAVVEYISPEDQTPAVRIAGEKVRDLILDSDTTLSRIFTGHLKEFTRFVEGQIHGPAAGALGLLTDILHRAFQPAWSVLARRKGRPCRNGAGEWTVLSEAGERDMDLNRALAEPSLCSRWDLEDGDDAYCLLAHFPGGEEGSEWRDEFCRLLLSLAVVWQDGKRMHPPGNAAPPSKDPDRPFQWERMAGSMIRSLLSRQTALLGHSDIVLITGETGTGKELAARSLHDLWQRNGDFVAINCAAIPAELLDAELFGVTAGAATGVSARPGRFAQAQGGTLFLDEISEMPLALQSKLLRVLQEKEYYPVGSRVLEKTDVRVIASSNQDEETLRSGGIRLDLFFRLSRAVVSMPPLRERRRDMAELCGHILSGLEHDFGRNIQGLSIAALEGLTAYAWPGNIRELQNLLGNLYMSVPEHSLIQKSHLPESLSHAAPSGETLADAVRDVEKRVISREVKKQGSVREAAKHLGLSEGYLYRKIKKLGITPL